MNNELETVIGLEIHIELLTKTKMYCSCKNTFGEKENTVVCPVCTGYPGALPAVNRKAVELAVRAGLALNCDINKRFKMSRKNYFYPDLPKGYQISQLDMPVCENGYLAINGKEYAIADIHLEEDAGKPYGDSIDFNRCGIPLIEVVTDPCFCSAKEALMFLKELRLLMIHLDVSDCKMEQGSMRCDVNVSVHRKKSPLGERCELKNVSGFSGVYNGILYEEKRQRALISEGKSIERETRRWDPDTGTSVLLRSKENTEDYRYFEEPDLTVITLDDDFAESVYADMPMLPSKKRSYYISLGVSEQGAEDIVQNIQKDKLFMGCFKLKLCGAKTLSALVNGILAEILNENPNFFNNRDMDGFCLAVCKTGALKEKGIISSTSVKILLEEYIKSGTDIDTLVKELKLEQISDSASIEKLVTEVLESNRKSADDYKRGKTNALAFLVGQCMKRSGGKTDPALCRDTILKKLRR